MKKVEYIGVSNTYVSEGTLLGLNKGLKELNIFPEDIINISMDKYGSLVWYKERKPDSCISCDYHMFKDADLCFRCKDGNKRQVTK